MIVSMVDYKFSSNCAAIRLLFSVRIMSQVSCALSKMIVYLLKLMNRRIICSLLYRRHSTWLSKLHHCVPMKYAGKLFQLCGKLKSAFDKAWIFYPVISIFTGSIARSANLPVFSLLTGRFWGFLPRRGDTLHRWGCRTSKIEIFTQIWPKSGI